MQRYNNIKFEISNTYYAKPVLSNDNYNNDISSVYFNLHDSSDDAYIEGIQTAFLYVDPDRDIVAKIMFTAEDGTYSDQVIEFKISTDDTYDLSS